jgi:hypothetical protein
MFQRRHYQFVADVIRREYVDYAQTNGIGEFINAGMHERVVNAFAEAFAADNYNFNESRFRKAAGDPWYAENENEE